MACILVIGETAEVRRDLESTLREAGHAVVVAPDGPGALVLAAEARPDLVVLDLAASFPQGVEICAALRGNGATRHTLVMLVSAKGDEIDRVVAFEAGVDDYAAKPLGGRELVLRVGALLRRVARPAEEDAPDAFGVLSIGRANERARVNHQAVELTKVEFKLLLALFDHKERVKTRRWLIVAVWGVDASMTTRRLDEHVKRLSDKLGPAGAYIQQVRAFGYRWRAAGG
jgi:two-component system phosphate regulon response regulator PhoB